MSFQAYLDAVEKQTGKTPAQLLDEVHGRGYGPGTKAGEVVAWLAEEYGVGAATRRPSSTWSRAARPSPTSTSARPVCIATSPPSCASTGWRTATRASERGSCQRTRSTSSSRNRGGPAGPGGRALARSRVRDRRLGAAARRVGPAGQWHRAGSRHAARGEGTSRAVTASTGDWATATMPITPEQTEPLCPITWRSSSWTTSWQRVLQDLHRVFAPGGVLAFELRNPGARPWSGGTGRSVCARVETPEGPRGVLARESPSRPPARHYDTLTGAISTGSRDEEQRRITRDHPGRGTTGG